MLLVEFYKKNTAQLNKILLLTQMYQQCPKNAIRSSKNGNEFNGLKMAFEIINSFQKIMKQKIFEDIFCLTQRFKNKNP